MEEGLGLLAVHNGSQGRRNSTEEAEIQPDYNSSMELRTKLSHCRLTHTYIEFPHNLIIVTDITTAEHCRIIIIVSLCRQQHHKANPHRKIGPTTPRSLQDTG